MNPYIHKKEYSNNNFYGYNNNKEDKYEYSTKNNYNKEDKYKYSVKNIYSQERFPNPIKNYGNNCYLNTGLQIIACCNEIKPIIYNSRSQSPLIRLMKDFLHSNSKSLVYEPKELIQYLSSIDEDFILNNQKCSQNFIRILIKSINKEIISLDRNIINEIPYYRPINDKEKEVYSKFCKNIFPESTFLSLFSGISKTVIYGKCKFCGEIIEEYMFNYYIDHIL